MNMKKFLENYERVSQRMAFTKVQAIFLVIVFLILPVIVTVVSVGNIRDYDTINKDLKIVAQSLDAPNGFVPLKVEIPNNEYYINGSYDFSGKYWALTIKPKNIAEVQEYVIQYRDSGEQIRSFKYVAPLSYKMACYEYCVALYVCFLAAEALVILGVRSLFLVFLTTRRKNFF